MLNANRIYGLAVAALVAPALVTAAAAHAKLVKENPAHDATVQTPPEVSLKFNESVEIKFSGADIKDAAGVAVKTGAPAHAGDDKTTLVVPISAPLNPGKYTVEWHVLTAGDGHKIKGSYSFTAAP